MKKKIPLNTVDGVCKTLTTRDGRLGWENYLGRLEHGGWDSMMTCVMEVWYEGSVADTAGD
jgi:hypothetical protein